MVHGVRADLDAALLQRLELRPAQEADVTVRDPARDHVGGRGHAELLQPGCGVAEHVAVAVVEGDHHRLGGQFLALFERREKLRLRDRVVAVPAEPGHLRGEVPGGDREGACDRGEARLERVDPVVHEDRDLDRARRKRRGERQPGVGRCLGRWLRRDVSEAHGARWASASSPASLPRGRRSRFRRARGRARRRALRAARCPRRAAVS